MTEPATILVVDDTPEILTIIERLLSGLQYRVITAQDGEAGLRRALEEMPDLIILDVMMPKMDGLEVCRRLKRNDDTRLIPIVMLTSKDYIQDKVDGLESGADDYITKPFNAKEFLARIRGIIERSQYRQKLSEEEKLDALEKMLESVAHEVRNPIVAIGGFARRIRDKLPPGDRLRVYAQHITQEVERLETMLKEIISLKALVVTLEEAVDLRDVAEHAIANFSELIDVRRIAVARAYGEAPVLQHADRKNLEIAFSHLVENAIEAMQVDGELRIGIAAASGTVTVTIKDTGRGIPPHEIHQVIRPFYTSKMAGAGMGLTMVKHIIVMHGGDVAISSRPGVGTTVTVTLPVVPPGTGRTP